MYNLSKEPILDSNFETTEIAEAPAVIIEKPKAFEQLGLKEIELKKYGQHIDIKSNSVLDY